MEHLLVPWVVIEIDNWDAVVQLESEGVHAVVDQDYVREGTLMENAHILDVEVWVACSDAGWSIETSLDQGAIWIEVVDDRISVLLLRGSEDDHLEMLVCGFKAFSCERSDVDASHYWLGLLTKLDWNEDVWIIRVDVVHAVDQRLIEIKDNCLSLAWMIRLRQVNEQVLDLFKGWFLEATSSDVVQGLHSLIEVNLLDIRSIVSIEVFVVIIN